MNTICIINGSVYDPKHGWQGKERDIFIEEGTIVDEFPNPDRVIDAQGRLVVAAGIDPNTHVATYGTNLARYSFGLPTAREIGLAYARMGYLHINEALMTINTASAVHQELSSIPIMDTSAFLVLDPRDLWRQFKGSRKSELEDIISSLLSATRAIGIKVSDLSVSFPKKYYLHRNVSSQKVLALLSALNHGRVGRIGLPISPKLREVEVTNATAFHLSQNRFDLHDGGIDVVFDYFKNGASLDLSLSDGTDVAILMGSDSMKEPYRLLSVGLGLTDPIVFAEIPKGKNGMHFTREILDLRESGISFSCSRPPGLSINPFLEELSNLLTRGSKEGGISLYEWVEATRLTPALLLGLGMKGHLGIGAQADIAIYDVDPKNPDTITKKKLGACWALVKKGKIVINDSEFVTDNSSKETFYRKPATGSKIEPNLAETLLRQRCPSVDSIFVKNAIGLSSD